MNPRPLFRIDRLAVLEFYDARPANSSKHAAAINAVAGEDLGAGLMKHYLENVEGATVSILDGTCTPGTSKGNRLDRWVFAQWSDHTPPTLFQVEIKNWSAHSIGGKSLPLNAPPEQVARHKVERWSKEWDVAAFELLKEPTRKVLLPMRATQQGEIEPALCMWDAMHPRGEASPWFSVVLSDNQHFARLWVFSMSAYLRSLDTAYIEIEMLDTHQRLQWLNKLFTKMEK
jgi:hypothetical protein